MDQTDDFDIGGENDEKIEEEEKKSQELGESEDD